MLTFAQEDVLRAIKSHCRVHGRLDLDHNRPLYGLLAALARPDDEVYKTVTDLYDLGLIMGVLDADAPYPVVVMGLSARGRQELASD
jgi:hypothetical protein